MARLTKAAQAERHEPTQPLTQLEFTEQDFEAAERMARHLGYEQTAYTSTSALWGLFCLPENPEHYKRGAYAGSTNRLRYPPFRKGCIIKTRELGLLFVQDAEGLGLGGR